MDSGAVRRTSLPTSKRISYCKIFLLWFIIHNCSNKESLKGLAFYISISIERRLFQDLTPILGAGKPLWSSTYVLDQDVVLLKLLRWTLFVHLLYNHGFTEGSRILAEQDFVKISCVWRTFCNNKNLVTVAFLRQCLSKENYKWVAVVPIFPLKVGDFVYLVWQPLPPSNEPEHSRGMMRYNQSWGLVW